VTDTSLPSLIDAQLPSVIELRHLLHTIPELGYEEHKTASAIREALDRLGIHYTDGVPDAPTATIATIGDPSRPCIALRADIDALPISERTGLPYASTHPGRMHACGHDGHSAGLVGAAAILRQLAERLPVCVKLLWQPAEEGGGGARRLIDAGALDGRIGPKVQAIFGLHGWPRLKVGLAATRPGVLLASTDNFTVTVTGRGCHGAYPHLGRDPLAAACQMVLSLQQVISREVDPTEPAVLTVAQFNGGTAFNVIPQSVSFAGTARAIAPQTRRQVREAFERHCRGIAAASDCAAEVQWMDGYPPTVNDPAMAEYVGHVARQALGAERFVPVARPSMGGEDFAYYLQCVPGCFFFIGVEPPDREDYPPLHSDRYDFTDAALATSMRMLVEVAMRYADRPEHG
jgi:amidohydrolase